MNTVFDDPNITVVGKIFLGALTAVALGHQPHIKIKASPEQVDVIKRVVQATQDFRAELEKPEVIIQSVMDKLQLKNIAAQEFQMQLGLPWPL